VYITKPRKGTSYPAALKVKFSGLIYFSGA